MLMTKIPREWQWITANIAYISACPSLSQTAVKIFILALDFEGPLHIHFLPFSSIFVGLYGRRVWNRKSHEGHESHRNQQVQ